MAFSGHADFLLGSGAMWISTTVGMMIAAACYLSPLLRIVGVDNALVLGLVMPPIVLWESVRLTQSALQRGDYLPHVFLKMCVRGVLSLLGAWAVFSIFLIVDLECTQWDLLMTQWAFQWLGPGMGVALAAALGCTLGGFHHSRWIAWMGSSVPFLAIGTNLYMFWTTPGIFSYGQFFGFFPGTFYDRAAHIHSAYLYFRISTLLWICLCYFIARAKIATSFYRRCVYSVQLSGLSFALLFCYQHFSTWRISSSMHEIQVALGQRLDGHRCTAWLPQGLALDTARLIAEDCDFRVTQIERRLGVKKRERINAYFFRSADEKRSLMGAASTFVAKPWRNEVYLQLDGHRDSVASVGTLWPHPVLAHEIAHVVAAEAARGPFKVSGSWGGWLPNPAVIEGAAVALAWDAHDGLTPHGWARALDQMRRIPPLAQALGTRFIFFPGPQAYVWFGSFMKYLLDTYGREKFRAVYRTGQFERVYGTTLFSLERGWRQSLREPSEMLDGSPKPKWEQSWAQARFSRESLFTERCSRSLETWRTQLLSSLEPREQERLCARILKVAPDDTTALLSRFSQLVTQGDFKKAASNLLQLKKSMSPMRTDRLEETLADGHWRMGDLAYAQAVYPDLLTRRALPEVTRRLELKVLAMNSPPEERLALSKILIPATHEDRSPLEITFFAHKLSNIRKDGLGNYLAARQLFLEGKFLPALELLSLASQAGLPSELFRIENTRMIAIAAYAVGHLSTSASMWQTLHKLAAHQAEPLQTILLTESSDWLERLAASSADSPKL